MALQFKLFLSRLNQTYLHMMKNPRRRSCERLSAAKWPPELSGYSGPDEGAAVRFIGFSHTFSEKISPEKNDYFF
jgi:hypothetical protein